MEINLAKVKVKVWEKLSQTEEKAQRLKGKMEQGRYRNYMMFFTAGAWSVKGR